MPYKPKPIPLLLVHYRKLAGYTQKEVQKELDVSARMVGLWETGRRSPNMTHLKEMAELYECSVAEFYDVDEREIMALGRARLREYLLAGKVKSEGERARLIVSISNTFRNDEEVLETSQELGPSSVSDLVHIFGEPNPDRMRIPVKPDFIPIQEESSENTKDFWQSTAEIVVLSGPRNCSKTANLCLYALWLCENVPGIQIGMCRSELTGIGETIWESFKLIFLYPYARDPRNPFYVSGGLHKPSKIVFENGSAIDFFGLHSENAQRGKQKHVIIINQVEDQDTQNNYSSLIAAMTGERAGHIEKPVGQDWEWRILMDCNPDIPLHWVYKLKDDPEVDWFDFLHKDHPRYYDSVADEYTSAGVKVRTDIRKAYPPGHMRQRMLDGVWAGAIGLVLNCFNPAKHLLPPDRQPTIELHWKHYRSTDWAYGGAHVTLWISTAPDGKSYVWQEYAKTGSRVAEHAEFTKLHSRDFSYNIHFADSEDASARAEYAALGIPTRSVEKDIRPGINTLNNLFAEDKLFIFEGLNINNDAQLINKGYPVDMVSEFAQLRFPDNPTGVPLHDNSPDKQCKKDRFDALRYWAVGVHGIKKRINLGVPVSA